MSSDPRRLLDVRNLTVRFPTPDGVVQAVTDISYTLSRGETLGVVGESGSGKSVSNLAIMGLLNRARTEISGEVEFQGRNLLTLPPAELQKIRGKDIAMVFQDPFACLHPMYRVGAQIAEAVLAHADVGKDAAWARAVELLDRVGIPNAASRARDYPHQFSGGMRQRAMIAMALVHNPAILICDEPTTALDVTVQAQILELIEDVKREFDIGVILVTHDLGVVAEIANFVMVMYAGRVMEYGARLASSSRSRSTPTRGACSTRCRASSGSCRRSSRSRARRPRCSHRRPAARSTRAAGTLRAVRGEAAAARRADARCPPRRVPPRCGRRRSSSARRAASADSGTCA